MWWAKVAGNRREEESGHKPDPSADTPPPHPASSHHPTSRSSSPPSYQQPTPRGISPLPSPAQPQQHHPDTTPQQVMQDEAPPASSHHPTSRSFSPSPYQQLTLRDVFPLPPPAQLHQYHPDTTPQQVMQDEAAPVRPVFPSSSSEETFLQPKQGYGQLPPRFQGRNNLPERMRNISARESPEIRDERQRPRQDKCFRYHRSDDSGKQC